MIQNLEQLSPAIEDAHNECLTALNGSLNQTSGILYHYTDIAGGMGILENAFLRLTDIRYCNDPNEIEDGLRIYNRVAESIHPHYFAKSPQFVQIMNFIKHALTLGLSFSHKEQELIRAIERDLALLNLDPNEIPKLTVFVACFSEHADNLRQWMPYANDGNGIALGFKEIEGAHSFTSEDHIFALKVCYQSIEKKEDFVKGLYEKLFQIFIALNPQPQLIYYFIDQIFAKVLFDIIACKSDTYKDELEWRLIRVAETKAIQSRLKFSVKDHVIKPYIEVPLLKESMLELILGPKAEKVLNEGSLHSLLKKESYSSAKIKKSLISYR